MIRLNSIQRGDAGSMARLVQRVTLAHTHHRCSTPAPDVAQMLLRGADQEVPDVPVR